MPLRRVQQPIPRPVTSGVVLEVDLIEPSQRVPDVGRVVDWKTPPPPGVDVRERPIREVSPFRRPESSHELRIGGNPWLELGRIWPYSSSTVSNSSRAWSRVRARSSVWEVH
jgi:hypothetical protein